MYLRADQIITGTAITLLALGLTGTALPTVYGATGVGLTIPTVGEVPIPGSRDSADGARRSSRSR